MKSPLPRTCLALVLAALAAAYVPALAATDPTPSADEIIAKARAHEGTEDKLNGVNSLEFTGDVFDATGQKAGSVALWFKKPGAQRSEFTATDNSIVVKATNGLEGWTLVTDKTGKKSFGVGQSPGLQALIYSGVETLYYYRGTKMIRGATVSVDEETTYRGNQCWKVSFSYPDSLTFTRYFDTATGELRGTIISDGKIEIVEADKAPVDGIIFGRELQYYDQNGKLTQTIKITKTEVNPAVDNSFFEMPTPVDLLNMGALGTPSPVAPPPSTPTSSPTTPSPLPGANTLPSLPKLPAK